MRAGRVDEYVADRIGGFGLGDLDLLVPAVHAADGIGLDGEGEVLWDAPFVPPNARGIGVVGLERLHRWGKQRFESLARSASKHDVHQHSRNASRQDSRYPSIGDSHAKGK